MAYRVELAMLNVSRIMTGWNVNDPNFFSEMRERLAHEFEYIHIEDFNPIDMPTVWRQFIRETRIDESEMISQDSLNTLFKCRRWPKDR